MNMDLKIMHLLHNKKPKFIGSLITIVLVLFLTISYSTLKFGEPKPKLLITKTKISGCSDTLYIDACESLTLSNQNKVTDTPSKTHEELFRLSVKSALTQTHSALNLMNNQKSGTSSAGSLPPMEDCIELLEDTARRLAHVLDPGISTNKDDVQTSLSSALTNQETCLDGLRSSKLAIHKYLIDASTARNVSRFVSNSLALFKLIAPKETKRGGRRLLSNGFPIWVTGQERKLLETSVENIGATAVVAKDGSGTHRTLAEALAFASLVDADGRTVIHVKAGTYNENLKIPSSQRNVMLVGDGKGITVITGSKNAVDGFSLLQSATFSATGDGFIARDITFVNSAGPAKHQAVALLVSSDKSVFYRCSIVGYQDTLYTLSNRQFYRETDIYGTVDFIFGNSAVVFQSCNIFPRKPMSEQKNFITAQGRTDPNQNTGISIQNCRIAATSDLASSNIPTYLGRPWKASSRTVIMQSFLDGSIHPSGWYPWSEGTAPPTIYYGEYMNTGPGASTSGRVKWAGYHPSLTVAEATGFTVGNLIDGDQWLPSTGVTYDPGLQA